uniref:Pre-mRNA-splicing factor SPF27 n=2 Tax=Amblyomma TaxID=6942 RepID=G3MNT9_AMBMU
MAGEVLVDALPYIDQGYDEPGIREAVMAMVEEETRRYRPTKNYLEHLPQLSLHQFESEIMKTEFERLQSRLPMEMMSMKRYELPQPPAGKTTDVASWSECVDNSSAQLEHQATRIANLELMARYGAEAWKAYNAALVRMLHQLQRQLQDLRKEIQEVNWQRKTTQTEAGEKLKHLEASWVSLVSKNFEIERACVELEKEIAVLEADYDLKRKALQNQQSQEQSKAASTQDRKDKEQAEKERVDDADQAQVIGETQQVVTEVD